MQSKNGTEEFDFDYWARMARDDPEAFETMRTMQINELIEQAPEQIRHRMEGLQWQINQVRKRSSNPMAACLRISAMMWDSVTGERGLLEALQSPGKLVKPRRAVGQNVVQMNRDDRN